MTVFTNPSVPFEVFGPDRPGKWLITCDHASNRVPVEINGGDLGVAPADMDRHIAYDIGALGVSLALGQMLNSPVVASNFSRLVIDPNRGDQDPTVLMKLYDGSIIPANRRADRTEKARRLAAYHRPYHDAIATLGAARPKAALLAIHSFTPQLSGRPKRPWHIGILHAHDDRLSKPLIAALEAQGDLKVGINEPYKGHLPEDSVDRHALKQGRHNTLVEIRNDLIETAEGQEAWAAKLAPILEQALRDA